MKNCHHIIKPPLATARAASCIGDVDLFVCLFVCLSVCLSPNCKNAIFSKNTTQFRARVSIGDLGLYIGNRTWGFPRTHYWTLKSKMAAILEFDAKIQKGDFLKN